MASSKAGSTSGVDRRTVVAGGLALSVAAPAFAARDTGELDVPDPRLEGVAPRRAVPRRAAVVHLDDGETLVDPRRAGGAQVGRQRRPRGHPAPADDVGLDQRPGRVADCGDGLFLLEEGAMPEQVDRAIEAFGFAMGPFRMSDLAGNDIGWHIRKRRALESPGFTYSKLPDLLCEQGRFGQKTGAGWYDYRAGERKALPSDTVNDMIVRHSADIGVTRRAIGDEEIVERLVYALVNEGAKIVEEGIALRASDVDMVYLSGYGFPLHRGGPMLYADSVGLPTVLAAVEGFARGRQGDAWQPAPLLARLASLGQGFNG